jgi:hypothetical protein
VVECTGLENRGSNPLLSAKVPKHHRGFFYAPFSGLSEGVRIIEERGCCFVLACDSTICSFMENERSFYFITFKLLTHCALEVQ